MTKEKLILIKMLWFSIGFTMATVTIAIAINQ
jgi:hypothetical protein